MPSWQLMLIGFFLGLMVDISYGFLGVNAAGLVLIGFLRNDVLYTIAQKSPDESVVYPHLSYLRWGKFIRYVTFTSVIFLTFTSILSTFSWHLFVDMLINTLINIGLSILVIMAIDILLFSTEAKEEGFSRV
jgi:rod shape-determining protein MreD